MYIIFFNSLYTLSVSLYILIEYKTSTLEELLLDFEFLTIFTSSYPWKFE